MLMYHRFSPSASLAAWKDGGGRGVSWLAVSLWRCETTKSAPPPIIPVMYDKSLWWFLRGQIMAWITTVSISIRLHQRLSKCLLSLLGVIIHSPTPALTPEQFTDDEQTTLNAKMSMGNGWLEPISCCWMRGRKHPGQVMWHGTREDTHKDSLRSNLQLS